jgi:Secretion system C-terminal sorting domain
MKKFFLLCILTLPLILRSQTIAFQKVYSIMQNKCASCHSNAQKSGGLDLEGTGIDKAAAVFANLVNVDPVNTAAKGRGLKRVYPGRVDLSFLFHKTNGDFDKYYGALGATEGSLMPKSGTALTKVEKEIFRQWILYGATKTATIPEARIVAFYDTIGKGLAAFETAPAGPSGSTGFQIKMGPFFLAPQGEKGDEVEYFQKWECNLPTDMEVNRIDHIIANYSHHFIVYNYTNTATPNSLAAGLRLNAYHNNINLVSAVQERLDLKLPTNTAYKWPKNRILDLNTHYINYSANQVYRAEAYINFYTQPAGTAKQEMFAQLVPNINISVPANNQTTTIESPFALFGKAYMWGLMGHTHKYGTGYKVFRRLPNGGKGDILYDASCPNGLPGCASPYFDYQHIPMRFFQPLTLVDLTTGVVHQATWKNTGTQNLAFGPTSDDEMMVLVALYTTDTTGLSVPTQEIRELDGVSVHPNPVKDRLTVTLPVDIKNASITFYDLMGRVIRRRESLDTHITEILRGDMTSGLYLYRIEDARGYFKAGKVYLE